MGEARDPDIQGKVNALVLEWEQFKLTFGQKPRLSRDSQASPQAKSLRWTRNTRSLQSLSSRTPEAEITGLLHKCISFKQQLTASLRGSELAASKQRLAFPATPEGSS